ncbi:RHS repeat-associated core domain-containing protein [Mucilaginibacter sp. cycad4]|uniref:RHS repeat domain-containing protein n=1 Tax=Mucilaginibacter sp. cycad4 TaxID=3342096 RepID=UPI002AABE7FF|nr:RHS repeat-associated core domain-containing protein [Mucilaginibacter gossypii]WPU97694.1 RHS repeat-associated core domain-containing protein [Mucilaginibacter gossypii]
MGNISSLGRYDNIGNAKTQIDTLTYTYSFYRLNRIDDASPYTGTAGFTELVKQASEYIYDGNGNELRDQNSGLSSISYNILNLPQTIVKDDGSTVVYIYSATGNKLRKLFTAGGTTTTTEYDNGIQYDNSTTTVSFIQTEEGRARHSGTAYIYEYDLKDHLGNTRVTLTPDPADPTQQTAKILQENDYYAFGYGIQSMQPATSPKNEYLYNHKELQEETGLYDYGARFYDPVIGRWGSVDPLVEDGQESTTPYGYVFDDPVKLNDSDGRAPAGCCKMLTGATVGGTAGGILTASLITGGAVAGGGTATVVGAPLGLIVGGGIILGGAIGAGAVWLWDHAHHSESTEPSPTPESTTTNKKGRGSNNEKTNAAAKTGQEAHRQEEKKLEDEGAKTEQTMTLKDGSVVRKDAVMPDGTAIIIKPNTPSGEKSAKKREEKMKKNGIPTATILYDPFSPAYQPSSPSYIGPKKK